MSLDFHLTSDKIIISLCKELQEFSGPLPFIVVYLKGYLEYLENAWWRLWSLFFCFYAAKIKSIFWRNAGSLRLSWWQVQQYINNRTRDDNRVARGFLQCLNSHLSEVINKSCYHSLPAVRLLWTKDGL